MIERVNTTDRVLLIESAMHGLFRSALPATLSSLCGFYFHRPLFTFCITGFSIASICVLIRNDYQMVMATDYDNHISALSGDSPLQ